MIKRRFREQVRALVMMETYTASERGVLEWDVCGWNGQRYDA
jgi:hypothetical protein